MHGLLEHTLSVGQAVSAVSASFPGVDRDVAVTGALIHDIGKIEAYGGDPFAIDLTDDGKLLGEIPLGYYLVRRADRAHRRLPARTSPARVLHIVLSHHGLLENGSPVVPCTREATVVHAIDNLGGKLGSFDRLEKGLQEGESWSRFDRALSGSAWFGAARSGRRSPTPPNRRSPPPPASRPPAGRPAARSSVRRRCADAGAQERVALPAACRTRETTSSASSWSPCWPRPRYASTTSGTAARSMPSCGPTG